MHNQNAGGSMIPLLPSPSDLYSQHDESKCR